MNCAHFEVSLMSCLTITLTEATRLDLDDMKLPRKKRMPARYDTTGTNFQFDDIRALHRSQFYESVDVLVSTTD